MEKDMKQLELAKLLGVEQQTISRYEREERQVTAVEIRRICEVFGVTADYLLGLSARRDPEISDADAALLDAYHAADEHTRQLVDLALQPYFEQEGSSASAAE